MANNLRKFSTEAEYTAATLNYPAVSWVTDTDNVHFDKSAPTPTFSGLTVYYNISDISQPTELFKGGGGSGSGSGGSGSGSGSGGGALPSAMIIDGTEVEPTNTYQFSTTGEHIVNYSFEDGAIPEKFLDDENDSGKFGYVTKVEVGDTIHSIYSAAFRYCSGLTSCTIGSGVTSIGSEAFESCTSLTSCTIGSGVIIIEWGAFQYSTSLTSINIPSGVTSIGEYAFLDCSGLTSITSNAMTAPTLFYGVFNGVSDNGVLTVPSGSQGYCGWIGGELPSFWTIEGVTCE